MEYLIFWAPHDLPEPQVILCLKDAQKDGKMSVYRQLIDVMKRNMLKKYESVHFFGK